MSDSESISTGDGTVSGNGKLHTFSMPLHVIDKRQKRLKIIEYAEKLLGIPYKFGAEWTEISKVPFELDCSEMVEGLYKSVGLKMPDGSQAQHDFCIKTMTPQIADLAFFGRDGLEDRIYHVGLIFNKESIIEARAHDDTASFRTGCVITRPISNWMKYKNFVGFFSHPALI